ncbi:MAG: hypothetical protein JW388_0927 [Nitrospira sp.]|nr:hypothetical protein [Nitrospira sp.]
MKIWSSLAIFFVIAVSGCADGAKLVQERANGGVVIYPFKGEVGAIAAASRKDALALMKEKCNDRYSILREGEARGRSRIASSVEGAQELVQERRWGIEFQCK